MRFRIPLCLLYCVCCVVNGAAIGESTPTSRGEVYLDSEGALHAYPVTKAQKKSAATVKAMLANTQSSLEFQVHVDGTIGIRLDSAFAHTTSVAYDHEGRAVWECGTTAPAVKQSVEMPATRGQ